MNAAVFVDFEDLHRTLDRRLRQRAGSGAASEGRARDQALEILGRALRQLRENGDALVLGRSYAAFDTQPGSEVAHDLALLGVDPQYVFVGSDGRDSADVQLTFDVARVLFRRPDIERIVILSGARDFLPLAKEVLEEGRELTIVSVSSATSGDLRERIGADRFVDALDWLEPEAEAIDESLESGAVDASSESGDGVNDNGDTRAIVLGRIPVTWTSSPSGRNLEGVRLQVLELLLRARVRHGSEEIWLSPFLKGPMSQAFAQIVHPERRALINELRQVGAIRVEERENLYAEHPYSVIVIDDQHPLVLQAKARLQSP